jgi:hypothetical protein
MLDLGLLLHFPNHVMFDAVRLSVSLLNPKTGGPGLRIYDPWRLPRYTSRHWLARNLGTVTSPANNSCAPLRPCNKHYVNIDVLVI